MTALTPHVHSILRAIRNLIGHGEKQAIVDSHLQCVKGADIASKIGDINFLRPDLPAFIGSIPESGERNIRNAVGETLIGDIVEENYRGCQSLNGCWSGLIAHGGQSSNILGTIASYAVRDQVHA